MYQTGSIGGSNIPVAFLMNGKQKFVGYTDNLLKKFVCVEGSTIATTPNGFMTKYAWEKITPHIITGIISMTFIKEKPEWESVEIIYGYDTHIRSLMDLEYLRAILVFSLKEEVDLS